MNYDNYFEMWDLGVIICMLHREDSQDSSDSHTVVATARGVFDSNGGVLESKETGQYHVCNHILYHQVDLYLNSR